MFSLFCLALSYMYLIDFSFEKAIFYYDISKMIQHIMV